MKQIVDAVFATTGLGSEQLFGIDRDHRSICKLTPKSSMLMDIDQTIKSVLKVQGKLAGLGETGKRY